MFELGKKKNPAHEGAGFAVIFSNCRSLTRQVPVRNLVDINRQIGGIGGTDDQTELTLAECAVGEFSQLITVSVDAKGVALHPDAHDIRLVGTRLYGRGSFPLLEGSVGVIGPGVQAVAPIAGEFEDIALAGIGARASRPYLSRPEQVPPVMKVACR